MHTKPTHSEGLRPSDSPTRALASRFVGSLRARGLTRALVRLAPLQSHSEGLRPSDSPTRALASRFVGSLRARGLTRALVRLAPLRSHSEGLRPPTPRHALSRAASSARSVRVGSLARSFAWHLCNLTPRGSAPSDSPDTRSREPLRRLAPCAWAHSRARSPGTSAISLRGASPLRLPDTRSREPLRRLAPVRVELARARSPWRLPLSGD